MTETASTDAVAYPGLPDESPMGAPLDWAWLAGRESEWGVQPKPSPAGPDDDGHRRRHLRRGARPPAAPLDGAPRRRRRPRHARHGLHPQHEDRRVGRQRRRALRGGRGPPVVAPPATSRGASCQELPDDIEHAMCQVCTTLTEVEMIAADLPAKWMWRMNHDFIEAKMFLCTQIMDEARHAEVFRKRALANGGGLLMSRGPARRACCARSSRPRPTRRPRRCMHLLGEGFILDIFRMGELIAPAPTSRSGCSAWRMQDEARHVAYGTMHIRYAVEHDPDVAEEIHEALDHGEAVLTEFGTAPGLRHGAGRAARPAASSTSRTKGFPLQAELQQQAVHVVPGPLRAGRHQPARAHQAPARPARHRPRRPSLGELSGDGTR